MTATGAATHSCQGCGRVTESQLCCPNCGELGRQSFFCSQDCFTSNWETHQPMHAILKKNRQLALKEEIEKKQTITSLAINSIKQIVRTSKLKADEEERPALLEAVQNSEYPVTTGRLLAGLLIFVFLASFWLIPSSTAVASQEVLDKVGWQEEAKILRAEIRGLTDKVAQQDLLISSLRRDLSSGLRELERGLERTTTV